MTVPAPLGVPSETRWTLPGGLTSQDLPPEARMLPRRVAEGSRDRFGLRPGLELYAHTGRIHAPVSMRYEILTGEPYLWLATNLAGARHYAHGPGLNGVSATNTSHFSLLRDPLTVLDYAPAPQKGVGALITPARLREMLQGQANHARLEAFLAGRFDPWLAMARPSPALVGIAAQILNQPYQGAMATLFLEAKAFEMLAASLALVLEEEAPRGVPQGRRQAMAARDILLADLAHPPRIEDLARQVGLSQRRLNEVFREVFGASPLQCLAGWRLDLARRWLAEGMAVKQVAYGLGYRHVGSFSAAFARRFGHPPSGARD